VWEANLWDGALADQLDAHGIPCTVVGHAGGHVAGFIKYHRLEFLGRGTLSIVIVDLVAFGALAHPERTELLVTALDRMRAEGIHVARVPSLSAFPARPLLATGFIQIPADVEVFSMRRDPAFRMTRPRRWFIPLREPEQWHGSRTSVENVLSDGD
jgi:hypothetical protein